MLVSGAALLLACAAFMAYDMVTFREAMVRNLSTQSQMIGSNTVSAMLFNDSQSAENTLSAFKAAHNIVSAGIYTPDGRLFASYSRDRDTLVPALPSIPAGQTEFHRFENHEIVLVRSIMFEGKKTGHRLHSLGCRGVVSALDRRYAGIAALVLSACLGAALLISSIFRKAVADPIVSLAEVAKVVSRDKNFSVRATPVGTQGELAILIDAFNEMLTQIQQSETALRKAHDGLEQRVKDRTAELEAAKKELEAFSHSVLRAKEEVERASKFKDQFLSTMSHELRTPLNAVLGFSDLLAEERYGPLNERQQRYVAHIHTGGKHLLRLINDILDLSKIEAGRLQLAIENVPVNTCIAEAIDTLRPLADKKSQTLVQSLSPELSVRADGTRFKQILMNLLGNAIKFTPDGGRIELSAEKIGNRVRVGVQDSGPGIPQEEQTRIFEAFYRLGQAGKTPEGTGLGLAITRRLVELHGGELRIESQVGSGSTFYFTLPSVPTFAADTAAKPLPTFKSGESARVLVVEDDPAAAHLIESHLVSAGYDVTLCDRPAGAVDLAAKLQPAAITVDIIMKPLNGWELLGNLKSDPRTARIPVIVISIVDQPQTGALLGADEYIMKPVQKETLLNSVERCMNRSGKLGQTRPILVVEDDSATREFIAELLCKQGYVVGTARNGEEARAKVADSMPDLVILDLILPGMSGFQLLTEWRINPRTSDLPIFVLTSMDLTISEKDYIRKNAGALFHKRERWQEALLRDLKRAVFPIVTVRS